MAFLTNLQIVDAGYGLTRTGCDGNGTVFMDLGGFGGPGVPRVISQAEVPAGQVGLSNLRVSGIDAEGSDGNGMVYLQVDSSGEIVVRFGVVVPSRALTRVMLYGLGPTGTDGNGGVELELQSGNSLRAAGF